MTVASDVELERFEAKMRQRAASKPLETVPEPGQVQPHGNIPNTPLAASLISFLLGGLFTGSLIMFLLDGLGGYWWTRYQLGFYLAAWSAFHWGEFAVTAGWNREKCSVDCEAILITIYFSIVLRTIYKRSCSTMAPCII
jgi:protein-S-isoprenylcysteine O-methyltransferase